MMPTLVQQQGCFYRRFITAIAISMLMAVSACTKSTDGLDTSGKNADNQLLLSEGKLRENQPVDGIKDETGAKIIRQKSSLSSKGTNIRALVNGSPKRPPSRPCWTSRV